MQDEALEKLAPVEVAAEVAELYPSAGAIFLAGSVIREEHTVTSDLDIVVVTEHDPLAPYRKSLMLGGWPVEIFVHTRESLEQFFIIDKRSRMPSLPQMCLEGLIVWQQDDQAFAIKERAQALIKAGPAPLNQQEILVQRYHISELLADLDGSTQIEENLFIIPQLVNASLNFYLALQQSWSGKGKWLWRSLQRVHPEVADRLKLALDAAYHEDEHELLVEWVERILEPVGGTYFDGHYLEG